MMFRLFVVAGLALSAPAFAAVRPERVTDTASMPPVDGEVPLQARLRFDVASVPREGNGRVAVHLQVGPGWHVYGPLPTGIGAPTRVHITSNDAHVQEAVYPAPATFLQFDGAQAEGYAEPISVMADWRASDSVLSAIEFDAEVTVLACKVLCVPGRLSLRGKVPIGAQRSPAAPEQLAAFVTGRDALVLPSATPPPPPPAAGPAPVTAAAAAGSLWAMLLLAVLGGLVLNVMPCVLPVLVMKAAALAQAGDDARTRRAHGIGYTLGTVGSMLALAGCVLVLRALGQAAGWGFQMQQPLFLAAVSVLLTLFCLHAFDVFTLAPPVGAVAQRYDHSRGLQKSVLEGVLAVLVATPCSAPFLGSATAFALSAPALVTCASFACIGLGLAAPFALLAAWPASRRLLPKPGGWMHAIKSVLAFALLGTVAWLVWLYAAVAGHTALFGLLCLLWLTAVGGALVGAATRRLPEHGGKALGLLLALLVLAGDALLAHGAPPADAPSAPAADASALSWQAWSAQTVSAHLAAQRPVLVEFTADWCVTCQYNERQLAAPEVRAALQRAGVVLLRADWTRPDETILAELTRNGRVGVPMTLLYDPSAGTGPERLPELLSRSALLAAIGRLQVTTP